MNKKISFVAILSALVLFSWVAFKPNKDANSTPQTVSQKSATVVDPLAQTDLKAATKLDDHHQHNSSNKNDDKAFDFTNFVTPEMVQELRPLTSRKSSDLEIKKDADGREYVDLKKRWSHATIVVKDKEGNKHSGDWAPEKK